MVQQQEIPQLQAFHAAHFPDQPIPTLSTTQKPANDIDPGDLAGSGDGDDGLGYYEDGVKRTLREEQIKMFRHSEIQRLLNERRIARAKEEALESPNDNGSGNPGPRDPRKRRFYDEPSTEQQSVDTLMYDDQPETPAKSNPSEKTFLWPVLGQNAS